jgi:tRNA A-37 threonylcarbamoyl transferase component Bud32
MAEPRRIRARREPTPTTTITGDTKSRLPEELLSEQVQRLALFCLIAAGLWSVGFVMDLLVLPYATGMPRNWRSLALEFMSALVAVVVGFYAATSHAGSQRKADVGIVVMLFNAGAIAALNTWAVPPPTSLPAVYLSWATILILVYSMVASHTPRRMLIGALVAASFDPIAMWLANLRGVPTPSALEVLVMVWPNFTCAVIAQLPSKVLHRLGRKLRDAQALGSYHLVELLGRGGMVEVWRAEHELLARQAAIKLVRPEVLGARSDSDAQALLRRFEREAQATAALSSPHTIHLFDFGATNDGAFYYVMELLAGRDLESLVRDFGPVPASRAVYLLRQVCHSLADAHARGFVHRDIKPANIYVCRMGLEYDFVKVLDFGLVKVKHRALDMQTLATMDHTTSGTPAYMAPETILGDANVDRRADVYALGCVAYYLLTGHLVFEADTPMKMFMQHLQATPVPPSQRTELLIPPDLDSFVLSCLEKDPEKRPQSARQLFEMACAVCGDGWTNRQAQAWWEAHLPELTRDLASTAPVDDVYTRASS